MEKKRPIICHIEKRISKRERSDIYRYLKENGYRKISVYHLPNGKLEWSAKPPKKLIWIDDFINYQEAR